MSKEYLEELDPLMEEAIARVMQQTGVNTDTAIYLLLEVTRQSEIAVERFKQQIPEEVNITTDKIYKDYEGNDTAQKAIMELNFHTLKTISLMGLEQ